MQAQIRYEEDKRQKELALRHRYTTRQEPNLNKKASLTAASSPMAVAHETPGHDHNGSVTMEASVMLYHPLLQIGKDQKTLKGTCMTPLVFPPGTRRRRQRRACR